MGWFCDVWCMQGFTFSSKILRATSKFWANRVMWNKSHNSGVTCEPHCCLVFFLMHVNWYTFLYVRKDCSNYTDIIKLEFITNLMHNFIYSIIILHHDLQHVSSIAVLIFRRTIVYLQYLVSSHSVCCHTVHRSRADFSPLLISALYGSIEWDNTRYCKYTIVLLKMSTAMLETCWGSWCNIIIE
jgi:hypothetical protein